MFYKNILFYGFWLFLTILLAYWFSYPLDAFSRHNFFGGKDQVPSLWVLNWQLTQLSSGNFDQLFTGNSFYPLDRPIYFNVSIFSTALFTLPVFLATKDPYICYAVAIFSSYILCSTGMLLLARSLKLDYAASFLAALVFFWSNDYLRCFFVKQRISEMVIKLDDMEIFFFMLPQTEKKVKKIWQTVLFWLKK